MKKCITILIKVVFISYFIFVVAKIGLYRQAVHKRIKGVINNNSASINQDAQVLNRLSQLTNLPFVGSYYVQSLADELIHLKKYEQGLQLTEQALSSIFRARDYRLWLSKAKAELYLDLLEDCQSSLAVASLYARDKYDDLFISIYFDQLKNKLVFEELKWREEVDQMDKDVNYFKVIQAQQNEVF